MTFSALGDAIRRCRADFGVEIDLDPTPVQTKVNGFSKTHCVVGTIHYPEQETESMPAYATGSAPPQRVITREAGSSTSNRASPETSRRMSWSTDPGALTSPIKAPVTSSFLNHNLKATGAWGYILAGMPSKK